MKNIFIAVCFFVLNSVLFAQNGAKIEFMAKDQTIDFGKVFKDVDTGMRVFEFKNTGNEPLIIAGVKATCGCTVPSQPTEAILPGQSGKIEVSYNMNLGVFSKSVIVDCNAINFPDGKIALKIKGEVIVKEEVNPLEKPKSMMENKL